MSVFTGSVHFLHNNSDVRLRLQPRSLVPRKRSERDDKCHAENPQMSLVIAAQMCYTYIRKGGRANERVS